MTSKFENRNSNFLLSVIVPTYNGAHRILRTLEALENQTFKLFEVLIVIDGSSDNTEQLLKHKKYNFKEFNIICQENKGRASVRNCGARYAKSNILVYYDDDMLPHKYSLTQYFQFYNNHPIGLCGGNQVEDIKSIDTDFHKYRCYLRNAWLSKYQTGIQQLDESNIYLTAANFSIRKKTFQQLGGFDESLTDAEDYDLALRALEQSIPVYFDKDNVAWHNDDLSCRNYINRRREYEKAQTRLQQLHPLSLKRNLQINYFKRLVYRFFSHPFWVKVIEKEWLNFIPKNIRYKIYTLIIWGLGKYYPTKKI